jgi:hypothetical protein
MLSRGGKKETVSPEWRITQGEGRGKGVLAWFYLVVVGKDGKHSQGNTKSLLMRLSKKCHDWESRCGGDSGSPPPRGWFNDK